MEPWLNRSSLTQFIGSEEIPKSFTVTKLRATTRQVVEGWLTDLLESGTVSAYQVHLDKGASLFFQSDDPTDEQLAGIPLSQDEFFNSRCILEFIAYAVWSIYVSKANAINTDTGIVHKLNPDSEPITDRQRAELSSYYKGLAERKALELRRRFAPMDTCDARFGSGRPILRKAQPKSPSRLGN